MIPGPTCALSCDGPPMSDPTDYTPEYNFSGFQANSPLSPLPATKLDAELANISTAIADHASAIEDVRRSDGALKNNIVTYDSLSKSLQLTFDPTNGDAVAAAIAVAQAAAAAASGSSTSAATSATNAATSAAQAAASAGSVNLTLFLSKAGNLAGIGAPDTARANISAMKTDASDATGRLTRFAANNVVIDWNSATGSGWYTGASAANSPPGFANWVAQVIAVESTGFCTQTAYPYGAATSGHTSDVTPFRRWSYDPGTGRVWTPWESASTVAVGSIHWFSASIAPTGYVKADGSLLSRTTYPALYSYAASSGSFVAEASWSTFNGAYSSGDLTTTFRVPDLRGEFIRGWDNGRGVDAGRPIGSFQGDLLRDHTHPYNNGSNNNGGGGNGGYSGTGNILNQNTNAATTGGVNGGLGGAETRPRNVALLPCIKT